MRRLAAAIALCINLLATTAALADELVYLSDEWMEFLRASVEGTSCDILDDFGKRQFIYLYGYDQPVRIVCCQSIGGRCQAAGLDVLENIVFMGSYLPSHFFDPPETP